MFARLPHPATIVGYCQKGLAVAYAPRQVDFDPAALRAEGMFDAVRRTFIQDETDRHGPINTQLKLVRFYVNVDIFNLLADCAAESANVIGQPDNLAVLSSCELIVCKRYRIDPACDVIQRAMDLLSRMATFLDGNRSQNELKVIFDTMLHFAK